MDDIDVSMGHVMTDTCSALLHQRLRVVASPLLEAAALWEAAKPRE